MKKAIFFISLFCCTAAFGQESGAQDDYSLWRFLRSGRNIDFSDGVRDISHLDEICVSLLLPLEDAGGGLDKRFGEFYRGALLALEELRGEGVPVRARLFNTPRNSDSVAAILDSEEFADTDLIIGPVYSDGMEHVTAWARVRGVAVVSPLTVIDNCGNEVLYQMAPEPETKYDKLTAMLTREDVNVVYINTSSPDREMNSALRPLLGEVKTLTFGNNTSGSQLEALFDRRAEENIFVVSCHDAQTVDHILRTISSMYSYLSSRGATASKLRVVGSAQWSRYGARTAGRDLYFNLGVCYVTNYHVDRTNARVRAFDGRYIAAYGDIPPSAPIAASGGRDTMVRPYAYRGYDAVKLFVGAAVTPGDDFTSKVNSGDYDLLQVGYRFEQSMWGDWRNMNWPLVVYRPDYRIGVE